jgi:phosphohistidine swiveling domain-containing protein
VPKSDLKVRLFLRGWAANQVSQTEGLAFISQTPEDARERISTFQNETPRILVCPRIDWSWSDVVNEVAGVVTDHGTRVSRGSEVSGIVQVPAVLGTKTATKQILEEDYIEIFCEGMEAVAKVYSKKTIQEN